MNNYNVGGSVVKSQGNVREFYSAQRVAAVMLHTSAAVVVCC